MPDAEAPPHSMMSTWHRNWVIVCVLAVFGPYIVSGIRTEQLAMYGSAIGIVATQLLRLPRILRPAAWILGLWCAYAGLVVIGGLFTQNNMPWPAGSFTAGADNALLPIATILTVVFWTSLADPRSILRVASWTLAGVMSVNALVALVTAYAGLGAAPFLGHFWSAQGSDASVAVLAEQMGRFSGVLNQPAEAGVAYSLGLFCVFYLARREGVRPRRLLWLMLVLIILGGLLTLSKVFVIGGLVVGVLLALTDRRNRRVSLAVGVGTVGFAAALGLLNMAGSWGAGIMLSWYRASFLAGDSFFYTLSAGRFGTPGTEGPAPSISPPAPVAPGGDLVGADGGLAATTGGVDPKTAEPLPTGLGQIAHQIFDHQRWTGVGARGLEVAYDSTWAEALIAGGLVGLLLIVAVHLALVYRWVSLRHRMDRAEWAFAGAVVLLVLGSSFGMPTLTGNRESTLLWIFVGLLLLAQRTPRAETDPVVPKRERQEQPTRQRRMAGTVRRAFRRAPFAGEPG